MSKRLNPTLPGVLALIMAGYAHASLEQAAEALAEGDYSRARVELEQVDEGDKQDVRWQLLDAAALAGNGNLETAESRYKQLIDRFPDNPEGYNNLAVLYARQGRFDEARALLEQAMQTSDSYATVYENLSSIYFEMSRSSYAKALQMEQGKRSASLEPLYAIDEAEPIRVAMGETDAAEQRSEASQPTVVAQAPLPPAMPEPELKPRPKPEFEHEQEPEPEPVADKAETVAGGTEMSATAAPRPEDETVPEPAERSDEAAVVEEAADATAAQPVPVEPAAAAEANREETAAAAPAVEPAGVREQLTETLNRWAAAWAGQNVEGYLSAYDETFEPGRGLSLEQWQAQRRRRLARPDFIQLELSDFEVVVLGGQRARVTLVQRYRSNTYSDKTRKRFRLIRRPEGWKIVSEKTIEVL